MLIEVDLSQSDLGFSPLASEFVKEGRARFGRADCFDFVPSDYELVWRVLAALPKGSFCEWGSGWGIITGLAEILGFTACGIEVDQRLCIESRRLLAEFNLTSRIVHADYLSLVMEADTYFVYCWPGMMRVTEERFERTAPAGARLVVAYGQSDMRCKMVRAA